MVEPKCKCPCLHHNGHLQNGEDIEHETGIIWVTMRRMDDDVSSQNLSHVNLFVAECLLGYILKRKTDRALGKDERPDWKERCPTGSALERNFLVGSRKQLQSNKQIQSYDSAGTSRSK